MQSVLRCALSVVDIHANLDVNKLLLSSHITQTHRVIWLLRAELTHRVVRETCPQQSVNVSLSKLQVTDFISRHIKIMQFSVGAVDD